MLAALRPKVVDGWEVPDELAELDGLSAGDANDKRGGIEERFAVALSVTGEEDDSVIVTGGDVFKIEVEVPLVSVMTLARKRAIASRPRCSPARVPRAPGKRQTASSAMIDSTVAKSRSANAWKSRRMSGAFNKNVVQGPFGSRPGVRLDFNSDGAITGADTGKFGGAGPYGGVGPFGKSCATMGIPGFYQQ